MKNNNHESGFVPLLVVIFIAVAASIGGGVYYTNHRADVKMEADIKADADAMASTTVGDRGSSESTTSLRALLSLGGSNKCTVTTNTSQGKMNGTVYISGSMMRGDFQSDLSGSGSMESHMIRSGSDVYVWSGANGAKMSMDSMMTAETQAQAKSSVELDQSVDYQCVPWTKSDAQFSVPGSVKFVDVSAMMKGSAPSVPAGVNVDIKTKVNAY